MRRTNFDLAATTPVRPEVAEAMRPYLADAYGNPSSTHGVGRAARAALEEARERVAAALGARRGEIVFTGGGTEADNLAVLGRSRAERLAGGAGGVVVSAIEHKAVLGAAHAAADEGAPLTILAVDEEGRLLLDALDEALAAAPAVVSVMWGNNEIGSLQPVREACERCRRAGVAFHSDAVQAFGKVPVRVNDAGCDLLSISAHKIGGPKGVGALFVRDGVALRPLVHGGGQEGGLRPGTQNVAGAVGLGVAAELAAAELTREAARLRALRDRLEAGLHAAIPGLVVNGGVERLPHVLNMGLPDVDPDAVLVALDLEEVAVSSGSACQSGAAAPSHVLLAIGRPPTGEAWLRFSLGWCSTDEDVDAALERVPRVVERVRAAAAERA